MQRMIGGLVAACVVNAVLACDCVRHVGEGEGATSTSNAAQGARRKTEAGDVAALRNIGVSLVKVTNGARFPAHAIKTSK